MDNDFKADVQINWSGLNIKADVVQICKSIFGSDEDAAPSTTPPTLKGADEQ